MKRYDIEQVLNTITYKPGYTWEVILFPQEEDEDGERRSDVCGVRMKIVVQDSTDPKQWFKGSYEHFFPHHPIYLRMIDAEYLLDAAFSMVRKFENHEIEERFKVNGEHYIDPHPGGNLKLKKEL